MLICISAVRANDFNDTKSDFDDLAGEINTTGENQILTLEKD